jgi:integrase
MRCKSLLFKYKSRNSQSGEYPIAISISRNGRVYEYLPFKVKEEHWNAKTGLVKPIRPNYVEINRIISNTKNAIEKIMYDNPSLPAKSVVEVYHRNKSGANTLTGFAREFIKECEAGKIIRRENTIKSYRTTLKRINEYAGTIAFDDLNINWYENFCKHLRAQGLVDNSLGKHIKNIKVFINEAFDRGITKTQEQNKKYFKILKNNSDTIYLTDEEIKRLISVDLSSHPHLQYERDRFIVSYYFLLRYSDSIELSKDSIFGIGDNKFIKIKPIKTGNEVIIPIKPIVLEILKKNKFNLKKDTNQESNRKIKEICKLSGIGKWDQVTTHTARRSGATNLYIESIKTGKPPVKLIMDLGGWKTESSFKLYIRVDKLESAIMAADLDFFK